MPGAGAVHHIKSGLMHRTNFEKNAGSHLHDTHRADLSAFVMQSTAKKLRNVKVRIGA
jgi:hypothetical protein